MALLLSADPADFDKLNAREHARLAAGVDMKDDSHDAQLGIP